jgi:uncharacterized protein (TIGR00730 family)
LPGDSRLDIADASGEIPGPMPDFTGGGIHALPNAYRSTGNAEFDQRISRLIADWGCEKSPELIQELIVTALKLARDQTSVADLKLFNRSLKELRNAARMFAPYEQFRKVVVFGSARTPPSAHEFMAAEEFARKIREHDFMIITGGGDGIMGAAQRGAGREHSFGLNIRLPFEQRANETIHGDRKLVNFNYFFTRKVNFVKEAHAVVLFPGGFGTMDEGFEMLTLMQTGKTRVIPLVLVDKPGGRYWETFFSFLKEHLLALGLISDEDFAFFKIAANVDDAVGEILQFYRNYRSYRWVGPKMVIRLEKQITTEAVDRLNEDFADIMQEDQIVQGAALPEEQNEPEILHRPRLILTPHRRNFGRLRQLIDAVNLAPIAA